jgi:hypothetical protein
MSPQVRYIAAFLCAVIVPLVLVWLDLKLTRGDHSEIALGLGLVVAAIGITFLPLSRVKRFLIGLLWLPLLCGAIFVFGLEYLCNNYGNCL